MNISIRINSQVFVPPPGRYYRVKWDWETAASTMDNWQDDAGNSIPIRYSVWKLQDGKGLPATKKSRYDIWTPIDEAYQRHEWEVWKLFAPSTQTEAERIDAHTRFHGGALAWCNKTGMEDHADFIAGKNLDKELPARESLCSRGNVLKLQDGFTSFGDAWWPFDCFSPASFLAMPSLQIARSYWLTHFATTQVKTKFSDGTWSVSRFPHNDGNDVPLPILTRDGVIWLERWAVEEVTGRVNPYNPTKAYSPNL